MWFERLFNFDDIGKKIKNFTKWYCWTMIVLIWIGSFVLFCVLMSEWWTSNLAWIPFIIAIAGPFIVYLSSWGMYAFGELVDNSSKQNAPTKNNSQKTATERNVKTENNIKYNNLKDGYVGIVCPSCEKTIYVPTGRTVIQCPCCGALVNIREK